MAEERQEPSAAEASSPEPATTGEDINVANIVNEYRDQLIEAYRNPDKNALEEVNEKMADQFQEILNNPALRVELVQAILDLDCPDVEVDSNPLSNHWNIVLAQIFNEGFDNNDKFAAELTGALIKMSYEDSEDMTMELVKDRLVTNEVLKKTISAFMANTEFRNDLFQELQKLGSEATHGRTESPQQVAMNYLTEAKLLKGTNAPKFPESADALKSLFRTERRKTRRSTRKPTLQARGHAEVATETARTEAKMDELSPISPQSIRQEMLRGFTDLGSSVTNNVFNENAKDQSLQKRIQRARVKHFYHGWAREQDSKFGTIPSIHNSRAIRFANIDVPEEKMMNASRLRNPFRHIAYGLDVAHSSIQYFTDRVLGIKNPILRSIVQAVPMALIAPIRGLAYLGTGIDLRKGEVMTSSIGMLDSALETGKITDGLVIQEFKGKESSLLREYLSENRHKGPHSTAKRLGIVELDKTKRDLEKDETLTSEERKQKLDEKLGSLEEKLSSRDADIDQAIVDTIRGMKESGIDFSQIPVGFGSGSEACQYISRLINMRNALVRAENAEEPYWSAIDTIREQIDHLIEEKHNIQRKMAYQQARLPDHQDPISQNIDDFQELARLINESEGNLTETELERRDQIFSNFEGLETEDALIRDLCKQVQDEVEKLRENFPDEKLCRDEPTRTLDTRAEKVSDSRLNPIENKLNELFNERAIYINAMKKLEEARSLDPRNHIMEVSYQSAADDALQRMRSHLETAQEMVTNLSGKITNQEIQAINGNSITPKHLEKLLKGSNASDALNELASDIRLTNPLNERNAKVVTTEDRNLFNTIRQVVKNRKGNYKLYGDIKRIMIARQQLFVAQKVGDPKLISEQQKHLSEVTNKAITLPMRVKGLWSAIKSRTGLGVVIDTAKKLIGIAKSEPQKSLQEKLTNHAVTTTASMLSEFIKAGGAPAAGRPNGPDAIAESSAAPVADAASNDANESPSAENAAEPVAELESEASEVEAEEQVEASSPPADGDDRELAAEAVAVSPAADGEDGELDAEATASPHEPTPEPEVEDDGEYPPPRMG